jgi:hypothetical protein
MILLNEASQIAKITGMSHWCPANIRDFNVPSEGPVLGTGDVEGAEVDMPWPCCGCPTGCLGLGYSSILSHRTWTGRNFIALSQWSVGQVAPHGYLRHRYSWSPQSRRQKAQKSCCKALSCLGQIFSRPGFILGTLGTLDPLH